MVKSKLNIIINRESADRALIRAKFLNKNYFGEIAYISMGRDSVDIKYIGRGCFFVPHMYKIIQAAKYLKIDERIKLQVYVDI